MVRSAARPASCWLNKSARRKPSASSAGTAISTKIAVTRIAVRTWGSSSRRSKLKPPTKLGGVDLARG